MFPGAGLDRRDERREVGVPEFGVGQVDLVVVASAQRSAVAGQVLGAGDDAFGRTDVVALEAADLGRAHRSAQHRILTGALDDATPPRIAGDVHHGRERPVDADRARFAGGDDLAVFDRRGIPGGGHTRSAPGRWCAARG